MKYLKNLPLAFQIWIILGMIMGFAFALVTLLFPLILKESFTQETYARIMDSQEYFLKYQQESLTKEENREITAQDREKFKELPLRPFNEQIPFRVVRHIFLDQEGEIIGRLDKELSFEHIQELKLNAFQQEKEVAQYVMDVGEAHLLYVIHKTNLEGKEAYLISYLWENYRENLVQLSLTRLVGILTFVLLISWIASIYITRYLAEPLKQLQVKVKEMANRKWDTPVSLNRADEIGQLGEAVEWMRCQLQEQNEKQQSFLQQVSHDLKTPVMVIRSYAQSIHDGIFPKGNLESSIKIIEDETYHLEERVKVLLNLTKYDYLATQKLEKSRFNLATLLREKVDRFSWHRPELQWKLYLEDIIITADRDKIIILLDNILDNQLRYAEEVVQIDLKKITLTDDSAFKVPGILLRFWNDGSQIEEEVMEYIFEKFKKGDKGKNGLGLAIARMIVEMHQGKIWAQNEEQGVAFYIELAR